MSTRTKRTKRQRPVALPIKRDLGGPQLIKELQTTGKYYKSVVIRVDVGFAEWLRGHARKHGKNLTAVSRDLLELLLADEAMARRRTRPAPKGMEVPRGDDRDGFMGHVS